MYNYRFLILFDASMCSPMTDPLSNEPRVLWDSGRGFITPQAIKYRIKKYLYDKGENILHFERDEDYTVFKEIDAYNISLDEAIGKELKYLDVRLFGSLDMATDKSNGEEGNNVRIKIKGPVSLSFAISVDPVIVRNVATNRTFKVDINADGSNQGSSFANDSSIIEYGLYSCFGGVNAIEAEKTGLTDEDIEKFFDAIVHMFDNDYSSMRPLGSMEVLHLFVWKWKDELVSNRRMKRSIKIQLKEGINIPSDYEDYNITVENIRILVKDYVF